MQDDLQAVLDEPIEKEKLSEGVNGAFVYRYVDINTLKDELTKVFGTGWSTTLKMVDGLRPDGTHYVYVLCDLTVKYKDKTVTRSGGGGSFNKDPHRAIFNAESAALQRAAGNLGNRFGRFLWTKGHPSELNPLTTFCGRLILSGASTKEELDRFTASYKNENRLTDAEWEAIKGVCFSYEKGLPGIKPRRDKEIEEAREKAKENAEVLGTTPLI